MALVKTLFGWVELGIGGCSIPWIARYETGKTAGMFKTQGLARQAIQAHAGAQLLTWTQENVGSENERWRGEAVTNAAAPIDPGTPLSQLATNSWRMDTGVTNVGGFATQVAPMTGTQPLLTTTFPPSIVASDSQNGQPCVSFNGTSQFMYVLGVNGHTGNRAYVRIFRTTTLDGTDRFFWAEGAGLEFVESGTSGGRNAVGVGGTFTDPDLGVMSTRELCTEVLNVVGTTWTLWRNGIQLGSRVYQAGVDLAALIVCADNNLTAWTGGQLFELGVNLNRALTQAEIVSLEQYARQRYAIVEVPLRTGTVMCMGDSRTAQVVANLQTTWVPELSSRLPGSVFVGRFSQPPYRFNEGVAGNTIPQMTARIAAALAANPAPAVYLFWGGVNDAAGGSSGAQICAAMITHIETANAISPTSKFVVMDEETVTGNVLIDGRLSAYNALIDDAVQSMRENSGIEVVRGITGSTLTAPDLVGGGDIHPNATGYLKIARTVYPYVGTYLPTA